MHTFCKKECLIPLYKVNLGPSNQVALPINIPESSISFREIKCVNLLNFEHFLPPSSPFAGDGVGCFCMVPYSAYTLKRIMCACSVTVWIPV